MICVKCGHDPDAIVAARWEFFVPRVVKSGNAHVHNVGAGVHAYRRERDGWLADLMTFKQLNKIPNAAGKRRVTLTRLVGYRQRAFDRDNLATGLKPCVDAMVRANLLVNDNAASVEIHYQQEKRGRSFGGLLVLIEELAA